MSKLFGEDSDSDAEITITTNKEYAKSFNQLRQKEMLQKFKDKRLSDLDTDELSSSSSEDDDEPFNPEFTKTFLKTLASLKSHDPKIYDKSTKFFDDKPLFPEVQKKMKRSGMDLKTYERKVLIETNGKLEDSDNEDNGRTQSPTIREEEKQIKDEFKKILNENSEEEADDWGNMFRKREKSKQELENEEMQYINWLAGQKTDIGEDAKDLNSLKEFWAKPNLSKDEAFLRDYILNSGYVEDDDTELNNVRDDAKLSDDEEEVERMEEFEHKYNFRFEEPDQEFIKRYPRTIEHSVRKQDDKRALKRVEIKDRKEKEKEFKLKELHEVKKIKQQEIEEKIKKLKEVTGNEKLAFDDVDFEEDFDPDEHDRKMQQIFDEEYYKVEEVGEKPECPDIEELVVENWDNYDPTKDEDFGYDDDIAYCEDDDFNMDADYDPSVENRKKNFEDELIENTKDRRKRKKRRNKFMEMIKKEKPVFDPEDEKTYGEYIDEYYKLDYEDIIGDQPCRFKYVETVPNNYGLSVEEIFLATNKELNTWASLKKAVQHRPDYLERQDVKMYQQRAVNIELKKKIFKSIYGEEEKSVDNNEPGPSASSQTIESKKKKKRNRKRKASGTPIISSDADLANVKKIKVDTTSKPVTPNIKIVNSEQNKPKPAATTIRSKESVVKEISLEVKKPVYSNLFKKSKPQKSKPDAKVISDNRLRAFGINPSKFHYQQKMANKQFSSNKKKKVSKMQKRTPA